MKSSGILDMMAREGRNIKFDHKESAERDLDQGFCLLFHNSRVSLYPFSLNFSTSHSALSPLHAPTEKKPNCPSVAVRCHAWSCMSRGEVGKGEKRENRWCEFQKGVF